MSLAVGTSGDDGVRDPWPIRAIRWYQRAMQGRPSPCRFTPSCSSYSLEAFETHRRGRALWLTVRRLSRCRPFGPSGYDPVPEPVGPVDIDPADTDRHIGHSDHRGAY